MDFIAMFKEFIKPELILLIPVLNFVGTWLKKCKCVPDTIIPLLLGLFGVILATIWVIATTTFVTYRDVFMAVFVAVTQGILSAGGSVYFHQIVKQARKDDFNA